MPPLAWDRVLETCIRRGGLDVLFVAGFPPALRVDWGLREFQVPPLTVETITTLAAEIECEKTQQFPGYRSTSFTYGEDLARLQLTTFGDDSRTQVAIASRIPTSLQSHDSPIDQPEGRTPFERLLRTCTAYDAVNVVLVPGSVPLLRCADGVRPFRHPSLVPEDFKTSIFPALPSRPTTEKLEFDSKLGSTELFRFAVFKWPTPELALLMRKRLPTVIQPFAGPFEGPR